MTPLVSVLVIAGTGRPYLGAALGSLVAQDMPDWEAIVVECCDEVADTAIVNQQLEPFATDSRVKVVRSYGHPTYPPYASRKWNRALEAAAAPFVAWLDDDDCKEPNWISAMVAPLCARETVGATVCGGVCIDGNGVRHKAAFGQPSLDYGDLVAAKFVTTGQMMVRRSVLEDVGGFDEALGCSEDWDFCLRLAASGIGWVFVESTRCLKREGVGNAVYHREASTLTQSALRYIVGKHGWSSPTHCHGCGKPFGSELPFVRAVPGEGFKLWHHDGCSQRFFNEPWGSK